MAEEKLNVMISSTSLDIPEYRQEILEACQQQGMHALRMEDLPAHDATAKTVSIKMVDKADIYVGVFAHRYGYVPEENNSEGISITEMEYNRAAELEIRRVILIMDENQPVLLKDIEQGPGAEKLKTFLDRVRKDNIVNFFKSPEDLRARAINSLSQYRDSDKTKFHYDIDIPTSPKPRPAPNPKPSREIELKEEPDLLPRASSYLVLLFSLTILFHLLVTLILILLPPDDFFKSIGSFIHQTIFGNEISDSKANDSLAYVKMVLFFLSAVISSFCAYYLQSSEAFSNEEVASWNEETRSSFYQFLRLWCGIWVTWSILYLYMTIVTIINIQYPGSINNLVAQITADALNLLTSIVYLLLFLVLDIPSVKIQGKPKRDSDFRKVRTKIVIASLFVFVLTVLGRIKEEYQIGVYLSGVFAGVSMAYVFGRLDSHHMRVPRLMLAPLHLYAVIQGLGPILIDFGAKFTTNSLLGLKAFPLYFFGFALLLKCYLAFVLFKWLDNGSFGRYFTNATKNLH